MFSDRTRKICFRQKNEKIFKTQFRFIYPERPTLYFSVCYLAISLAVMAGLISPEKIACNHVDGIEQSDIDPGLAVGTESTKCTVVFTVIYFFASESFYMCKY